MSSPFRCALTRLGADMFGHLRLQEIIQAALHERAEDIAASEQIVDLIVVNVDFNTGHGRMLGLVERRELIQA